MAFRSRTRLQPAGGSGDKIMPPTYGVSDSAETKYAVETRSIDGEEVKTVLLDSVASQANRMEMGLLEGWELNELDFPVALVDFSDIDDLQDLGAITVLEAPHRIADAIFRDSCYGGTLFRLTDVGIAITESTPRSATALYQYSPTALVFGMWDSTGPRGGLGSKFERALVSEIVGVNAKIGVKVGSRIDPLGIEKDSGPIYEHRDRALGERWTLDPEQAVVEKGKAKLFDQTGSSSDKGRPSMINHGNVTPSIDTRAGGVTIDYAEQTTVLSLAALRRLRFPVDSNGNSLDGQRRLEAERAARTTLAALGLCAVVYQYERDYDLRSRCLLVPEERPHFELVYRDGSAPDVFELNRSVARMLLDEAREQADRAGISFTDEDLRFEPAPKLVELIRRSRALAGDETVSAGEEGEGE